MKYWPIHLHMHSAWESQASMEGHFYNAQRLGMQHMYITDHDSRMGPRENQVSYFDFSQGEIMIHEPSDDPLRPRHKGFTVEKQDEDCTWFIDDNKILNITAKGKTEEWSTVSLAFGSSQKRHEYALLAKTMLHLAMHADGFGENARVMVDVKLSQRPPEFENGHILYVAGNAEGLENAYRVVKPLSFEADTIDLNLLADAEKIGGGDNILAQITFSVSARCGAEATLFLKSLSIDWALAFEEGRIEQQRLADEIGKKYGVTPIVTYEITAAGPHKICFSTKVPVIDYQKHNYNVTEQQAIEHVKAYGGIYARNHPFDALKDRLRLNPELADELAPEVIDDYVSNRAYGATMLEVGFTIGRNNTKFSTFLKLWDTLSANGIFISGYGDSDNHSNSLNWFDRNNFCAYIAAENPCENEFIESMKAGNLYTGDPVYLQHVDFCFYDQDGNDMGNVVFTNETKTVYASVKGLPEKSRVVWTVNGKDVKTENVENDYTGEISVSMTDKVNFVRVSVYKEDRCILLSNPIYYTADESIYSTIPNERRAVEIPAHLLNYKGEKLLHIGDIPLDGYPFIKKLIRKAKADIIVHTGDLCDNLKAGRKEEDIPLYKDYIPTLIKCMENHAKQVFIVRGNNDLPEYVQKIADKSKVVEPNTIVTLFGKDFLLCHRVIDLEGKADVYLYGHGPTGDEHSFYKKEDGSVYSNAYFAPAVFLENGEYAELKNYNGNNHK